MLLSHLHIAKGLRLLVLVAVVVRMTVIVVVALVSLVLVVVALAASIGALLLLSLVVVAAALAIAACRSLNLNLGESLDKSLVVGLCRVVGYGNGLGGNIYLNILNALLVGNGVGNLLCATLAVDIGEELGGYALLLALLGRLCVSYCNAEKCYKAH